MTSHHHALNSRPQARTLAPRRTPAHRRTPVQARALMPLALGSLLLAGCATGGSPQAGPAHTGSAQGSSAPASSSGGPKGAAPADATEKAEAQEVSAPAPRLLATFDGGLVTLDATTLQPIREDRVPGFLRVNPAGDNRHAFVTTPEGFRLYDLGSWAHTHKDHSHYYAAAPKLTSLTVPAREAGHVVVHEGRTALFADGTGEVTILNPSLLARQAASGAIEPTEKHRTLYAHHGVAVPLGDGGLVTTRSQGEKRVGMTVLKPGLKAEAASSEQCPGTHGESAVQGGAVLLGCEDGALILKNGAITKVTSPDPFGRIGNQAGSPVSPISLGDYKTNPKGGTREHPTRVSLIDTRNGTLRLVDVKASYSFRSLGRGPAGEALVLGDDGVLRVIDPASGKIQREIPVTARWSEPEEWQQPRPTLFVAGKHAYVTEPGAKKISKVDITTGKIVAQAQTKHALNELTGVTGGPAEAH